ncbi:MAG: copper-binding protein [Caldimonas sp.]
MNFKSLVICVGLASVAPWAAVSATDTPATGSTAASRTYSEGEVRKVDTEQGKITLKHGPIDNLGMPAMTMVFRSDAGTLAKVKVGDVVKFKADKVDGAIKVTELLAK